MANLDLTLRFKEDDCGLQTLRNVCRAGMIYLDGTPEADCLFVPAEVELMREMAAEVEGCADQVFEMVITLKPVVVPRSQLSTEDAAAWDAISPPGYVAVSRSNLYGATSATFPPDEFGNVTRGGSDCELGQTLL